MTGSTPYSISQVRVFQHGLKKFIKQYQRHERERIVSQISSLLESLTIDPFRLGSAEEPLPPGVSLDRREASFRKFRLRYARGASGQLRLMYLVLLEQRTIAPIFVYSHEEYAKRPPSGAMSSAIREALEEMSGDLGVNSDSE